MIEDRRRHPRSTVLLVASALQGHVRIEVVCTNVSAAGAYLSCRVSPAVGAAVDVQLRPPEHEGAVVSLLATVVRTEPRGGACLPGFAVAWQQARCEHGEAPLRQLLVELLHLAEPCDLTVDPSGAAEFDFASHARSASGAGASRPAIVAARPAPALVAAPLEPSRQSDVYEDVDDRASYPSGEAVGQDGQLLDAVEAAPEHTDPESHGLAEATENRERTFVDAPLPDLTRVPPPLFGPGDDLGRESSSGEFDPFAWELTEAQSEGDGFGVRAESSSDGRDDGEDGKPHTGEFRLGDGLHISSTFVNPVADEPIRRVFGAKGDGSSVSQVFPPTPAAAPAALPLPPRSLPVQPGEKPAPSSTRAVDPPRAAPRIFAASATDGPVREFAAPATDAPVRVFAAPATDAPVRVFAAPATDSRLPLTAAVDPVPAPGAGLALPPSEVDVLAYASHADSTRVEAGVHRVQAANPTRSREDLRWGLADISGGFPSDAGAGPAPLVAPDLVASGSGGAQPTHQARPPLGDPAPEHKPSVPSAAIAKRPARTSGVVPASASSSDGFDLSLPADPGVSRAAAPPQKPAPPPPHEVRHPSFLRSRRLDAAQGRAAHATPTRAQQAVPKQALVPPVPTPVAALPAAEAAVQAPGRTPRMEPAEVPSLPRPEVKAVPAVKPVPARQSSPSGGSQRPPRTQPSVSLEPVAPLDLPDAAPHADPGRSPERRGLLDAPLVQRVAPPARIPQRQDTIDSAFDPVSSGDSAVPVNQSTQAYTRSAAAHLASSLLHARSRPASGPWPLGVPHSLSDRYGRLEHLGQGGQGVVFRAVDRHLDRVVVLKFMGATTMSSDVARKYFLREVKLAASLNHPNIAHIYDIGKADDVPYYAMEYVDGVPLSAYLPPRTPIRDLAFLFSVLTQLCDALDHAHGLGVLHRDVKPDNVLVAADGTVKLFDFGLVRVTNEGLGEQSVLIGTPHYMAPEQRIGGRVDHRTDIYALGVTTFRMLTGHLPFTEGNIFVAHATSPVPDPRSLQPELPPTVNAVTQQMLAKKPSDRFDSCREIAVAMHRALFGDGDPA